MPGPPARFDTTFTTERRSTQFLVSSANSHRGYGFVMGADYTLGAKLTLSAGVDGRMYYGLHYREIRDLPGGTYTNLNHNPRQPRTNGNFNEDPTTRLGVGDSISYTYDGKTQWLGGYTQIEYKTPVLSAMVSSTVSRISYKRLDYFQAKAVSVDGADRPVGFGQSYTAADG